MDGIERLQILSEIFATLSNHGSAERQCQRLLALIDHELSRMERKIQKAHPARPANSAPIQPFNTESSNPNG